MRPNLSWSDLRGRRVGLYGLGREGLANLRKCRAMGVEPVLVDDAPRTDDPADGSAAGPVLATGHGGLEALLRCEVVVKTPGISPYTNPAARKLARAGIPVTGGLALWLHEADLSRVVCITGTKGKSTTSAVAGHLLTGLGYRCLVGGNIGAPPHDPALGAAQYDFWVIEVSSYQAADIKVSPQTVAVTSLHPDHLPWHGDDPETYYRDKLSLCSRPGADLTIANGDSDLLRARRDQLGPRVQWVHASDDPDADWTAPLGLLGGHNRRNALIARACLRALAVPEADDAAALSKAAVGFEHLPSRLRPIGTVGGVLFVDDSLSTNVLPTLAALDAFPDRRVALIVGGLDRHIDYTSLAVGLRARTTPTLVLTVPDNGPLIAAALRDTNPGPTAEVAECDDFDSAVRHGYRWGRPDGVVLLSPAAASFGRFADYRARGDHFAALMRTCAS
jgi:UDP-N-acetylmuramoyl-L-alanine---L-glutamate ligase